MGRHVWFRRRRSRTARRLRPLHHEGRARGRPRHAAAPRRDRSDHERLLARDDRPGLLDGTHDRAPRRREQFAWGDLVEAMTTIESGTAIGTVHRQETRAVAIHEAGPRCGTRLHEGRRVDRLSIRMRGGSLGHHQALEKEERFSRFRSEEMARLVWTLGAMAAERVFYGENSNGVGATSSRPRRRRPGWSARPRWGRSRSR